MTTLMSVNSFSFVLTLLPIFFAISFGLYTGSWCPYKVERTIPCRVRNGSEPYYGPNICWRNENGSYACTKKILYRPKYTVISKRVFETQYKCCPGMVGPQCDQECFNCSSYQRMEARVAGVERRLSRLEKTVSKSMDAGLEKFDRLHRDQFSHNNLLSPSSKDDGSSSLAYVTTNLRLQTLLDEFRDMQNRIQFLENELSRVNAQVNDFLPNEKVLDNGRGNNANSIGGAGVNSDDVHLNKDALVVPSPITGVLKSDSLQHGHNSLPQISTVHHHGNRHSGKSEHIIRVLEENLERGDIASTLNDDYGDEVYNDGSTEQYIDQLHPNEEHTPYHKSSQSLQYRKHLSKSGQK